MTIQFLGHAGLAVSYKDTNFLMDPWFNDAFMGSWVPFPPLKYSKSEVQKFAKNCNVLWISHEHSDHLDSKFLKLLAKDTNIIIPKFEGDHLKKFFIDNEFQNITELNHRESTVVNEGLEVEMILEQPTWGLHSSIFVKTEKFTLFHNSDSNIEKEDLKYLNVKYKGCDYYAGQYSITSPYPDVSLEMDDDDREEHHSDHLEWSLGRFSNSFKYIGARSGIACAGPAVNINLPKKTLLKRLNEENNNNKNYGFNFSECLKILKNQSMSDKIFIPKIGDKINENDVSINVKECNSHFLDKTKVSIIEQLPFNKLKEKKIPIDQIEFISLNKRFFKKLLLNFIFILDNLNIKFFLNFTDINLRLAVDFPSCELSIHNDENLSTSGEFFELIIPSFPWYDFINGKISYDEIHYSKCYSTRQSKKGYKKEIFIALRAINDRKLIPQIRNHFLSDNKEVFEVQRNGEKKIYSLRCPHLGMRLDPSNLNKNGELICPGHGWRFSLENGKCVFGDLSQSIVIKDCSTKKNN